MNCELINRNIKDLTSFLNYNDKTAPCFCRGIGCSGTLESDIRSTDISLLSDDRYVYRRITLFPAINSTEDMQFYSEGYEKLKGNEQKLPLKNIHNESVEKELKKACSEIFETVRRSRPGFNITMEKNLAVLLLYWSDLYLTDYFSSPQGKMRKLVCSGKIGYKEYCLCLLAALMGIDVLILLPSGDINIGSGLMNRSSAFVIGNTGNISLPEFDKTAAKNKAVHRPAVVNVHTTAAAAERTYEELAALAESVVMIEVQNSRGKTVGTGSGIVINSSGYILTNCHVAAGGVHYLVRTENDSNAYPADKLIKYHPTLDLAVIRIEKSTPPLVIYNDKEELKRGQKVVAIGSPLGLFNSVSDGIISGIRKVDGNEMIQFTAPISAGSSGGAVLNMQGQVIGISTAGIDGGQNINLAVSYKDINMFIGNFIR